MFDRSVLKSRAKSVLSVSYWQTLGIMLIFSAATSLIGQLFVLNIPETIMLSTPLTTVIFGVAMLVCFLFPLAASIFLIMPLQVGVNKFVIDYAKGETPAISTLCHSFRNNYKRIVLTLFMKGLIITAYMLIPLIILCVIGVIVGIIFSAVLSTSLTDLLAQTPVTVLLTIVIYAAFIPAVIKTYDYYMVEYLLADDPELTWREALGKSKQMMRGNRFATFILGLSFIGWQLLGILLCGVGAVFVTPYIMATDAQLYLELSGKSKFEL